jgi:nucleoside 2-deoxyribosyltransferase
MKYLRRFELNEDAAPENLFKIYLAGPDVFKENALKDLERLKEIAQKYGQRGLAPLDNEIDLKQIGAATKIFKGNVDLMDICNVIIANLEPFRGPNMDDGTAFELGYGFAKGKLLYGYTNHHNLELKDLTDLLFGRDPKFPHVEDFGYTRNLMIVDSIRKSGGNIFNTFEECVVDLVSRSDDFFQSFI